MKDNSTLSEEDLATVGEFRAIVAQGKKRPQLDAETHKNLVQTKFENGQTRQDHVTLFRVDDKKGLARKEINNHTVKGPYWTPPSSVGFVLGAMSSDLRIWLASKLSDDAAGIAQTDGEPAIYARELVSPIISGYTPRDPHAHEQYGNTGRGPRMVLTPPKQRKFIEPEKIQKTMDVKGSWDDLPLDKIYLTSLPKLSTFNLKEKSIDVNDFHQDLLEALESEEYEEGLLCILINKEVLVAVKAEKLSLGDIMEIYNEYIEDSKEEIDADRFLDLCTIFSYHRDELDVLYSDYGISLECIVDMYNDEYELFRALGRDVLEDYENEIDWQELRDIYTQNQDLFYAIINDPENIVNALGLREFIDKFKEAQLKIAEIPPEDVYYGAYDPYDIVAANLTHDNCPDEILKYGSESESENEDSGNYSTDIYSDDNIDNYSDDCLSEGLSSEDSSFEDFTDRFSSLRVDDLLISPTGEVYYSG